MPPTIDFSKIRQHAGSQHRAFEELCYQLIHEFDELPKGTTLRRHGSPDGGSEATATLPGGAVWAWQAKYLSSLGNTQFQELDASVKRALETQPDLVRYTFCLPYNRPAGAPKKGMSALTKWERHVTKWKGWASKRKRTVDFHFLGESELLQALTPSGHAGRIFYWFNTAALSTEWFVENLQRAVEDAGPRYTPELNIDLPISSVFDGLGRTELFETRLRAALRPIRDTRRRWSMPGDLLGKRADIHQGSLKVSKAIELLDSEILSVDIPGVSTVNFEKLARVAVDIEILVGSR